MLMSSFKFIYFFHVVVEVVELLTKLFIREVWTFEFVSTLNTYYFVFELLLVFHIVIS